MGRNYRSAQRNEVAGYAGSVKPDLCHFDFAPGQSFGIRTRHILVELQNGSELVEGGLPVFLTCEAREERRWTKEMLRLYAKGTDK